jgi:hypothetical protein
VVGVDPEPDMLRRARQAAKDLGVPGVSWMLGADTDIPAHAGPADPGGPGGQPGQKGATPTLAAANEDRFSRPVRHPGQGQRRSCGGVRYRRLPEGI